MFRTKITAVVFVAAMALAGARPAAAEGLTLREAWDWLGRLWSGVTFLQPVYEGAGLEIDPDGGPMQNGDCGPEIDPDGKPRPCPPAGFEIDPNG